MVSVAAAWRLAVPALRLTALALLVRVAGTVVLGDGAPFGPDGTGAEAGFVLGGHPYPLHMLALYLTGGDVRALSVISSAVSVGLLAVWSDRLGLGPRGAWMAVVLPLAVFTGVLAGGDAPAMAVVLAGAVMSTGPRPMAILGGALAVSAVAVKPIALPMLVLLLARPWSLLGVAPTLVLLSGFLRPLWQPMPDGGILGSWWVASGGALPLAPLTWALNGWGALFQTPIWSCAWALWFLPLAAIRLRHRPPLALSALAVLIGAWGCAALFGPRMEPRYLAPVMLAALPFVGWLLPRSRSLGLAVCAVLLWPTAGVLTQLANHRAEQDPLAAVAQVPSVPFPVDVRPIFDSCSTPDATRMRLLARQIADVAPLGAIITTTSRPDGREGELFWPLQVLRPDIKVQVIPP
jgi:hypothetical protein